MSNPVNIFWFRRDLSTDDNVGLFAALSQEEAVLPIFIFDKDILSELPKDDARVTFIHDLLTEINSNLKQHNSSLAVFYGAPNEIFKKLIANHTVKNVFTNRDYEPYALKRDSAIEQLLSKNGVGFKTYKNQVIFETDQVVKDDQKPYVVYTPYSKRWLEKFSRMDLQHYPSECILNNAANHDYPFLELDDIGFERSKIEVPKFTVDDEIIAGYEDTRNLPALDQTSHLSPYLRFGVVSI
ncbi:MAG: deoxyribodipyrimidine photo-lyase, partial [Flavobacterium sp.]